MEKRSNILYRLALFWGKLPPDSVTMLLAVLEYPESLLSPVFWILNVYAGEYVKGLLTGIFMRHVWPMLPLVVRHCLSRIHDQFLAATTRGRIDTTERMRSSAASKHSQRHPHW